jgi:coenzyme PQQ biosynthesis protein PqqD
MSQPIPATARPKLARRTRLRFDRHSGKHWLVYPERGLLLSDSAASIAALCTGTHTLDAIVSELHASANGVSREQLAKDVQDFIAALRDRALVELL